MQSEFQGPLNNKTFYFFCQLVFTVFIISTFLHISTFIILQLLLFVCHPFPLTHTSINFSLLVTASETEGISKPYSLL